MRFKLIIAYEGTHYCGWQVQPNGTSIQTLIQRALETVLRHPIALTGAGRTDSGVHALGQVAHFDTEGSVDRSRLFLSLNALLPVDIRILSIEPVADSFHARYDASGKIYHYHIQLGPIVSPMIRFYRTQVRGPFDLGAVRIALSYFVGTHDFRGFVNTSGKPLLDSVRELTRVEAVEQEGGIRFEFEGSGFLYKMVRNMVGTLLEVGAGSRDPDSIKELLQYPERQRSGPTAPPQGLFLMKVSYCSN